MQSGGCLPGDTRPPPGVLLVTAAPDASVTAGIGAEQTADGWAIYYDRFLITLGRVELGGDDCTVYSNSRYTRVLDLLAGGEQKVSEHFALGHCELAFGMLNPDEDSVRGPGVSDADLLFLRTPEPEQTPFPFVGRGGVSAYVEGHAVNGAAEKHFAWPFRWQIQYDECSSGAGDQAVQGLDFAGGEHQGVALLISGSALFQDAPDPARAELRFDPFASADTLTGNDDGEITLDELSAVPVTQIEVSDGYREVRGNDVERIIARLRTPPTLEDYLYAVGFASLVTYPGGSCSASLRARRQPPD